MIFPYDSKSSFSDPRAASPAQRPASRSDARKRAHLSEIRPVAGTFGRESAGLDPHLDNGFAEVIRKAKAEAWDQCAVTACDLGWMHEHGEQDVIERNPFRSAS